MSSRLHEWVDILLSVPGEKYDLSSIAKYNPLLEEALGEVDLSRSFFWSGMLRGEPEVLERIIETQGYNVSPECVMPVSGGTSIGIHLTCLALLRPGDEVVCEHPGWQQVPSICIRKGIPLKLWHLRFENNWQPDLDALAELVTPETRMIYINHPHNPTGAVISEETMTAICDIASRHGAYILSDEINRGLEWTQEKLTSSVVNHYERGIAVASLSKAFGATGLRYGWFATQDRQLYEDIYGIYSHSVLCNNHPAEIIAHEILKPETYKRLLAESKSVGKQNLEVLTGMIENSEHWNISGPGGSFACFPRYETGEPSWEFADRMLRRQPKGLEVMPGSAFGEDYEYHLRLGIGSRPEHFKAAIEMLDKGIREHA
jgi:aspartate/methionine/tyrosine aminotransferase